MLGLFLLHYKGSGQLTGGLYFFFFFQNYVYVKVIKAWKAGVVGRGVKAIIWEEKKNGLSSDCQWRKRLCFREGGEGLGPEGLSGHLLARKATSRMRRIRGHRSAHSLACGGHGYLGADGHCVHVPETELGGKAEPEEPTPTQPCALCICFHGAAMCTPGGTSDIPISQRRTPEPQWPRALPKVRQRASGGQSNEDRDHVMPWPYL